MDDQERNERQEAAYRYADEDERLFVDYVEDCIKHSTESRREIREMQAACYRVFKEEEPDNYADKEPWQSRVVVPKPFATVMFGASAVRKAFSPHFLSVRNVRDHAAGRFWQRLMEHQLAKRQSNFPVRFGDATVMGLGVGQSMEMIPRWVPGKGLEFSLVEPWKIQRDPDAPSRDPQGGMYWIHQEWLDYHVLKQGEESGKYFDVGRAKNVDESTSAHDDPFMSQEAIKRRKQQVYQRSNFRTSVLTSEFWGIVLDKRGEVLLPEATLTIAGGRLIERPRAVGYKRLRWPGIDFMPLPDLLQHGGRGLLEGVISVWDAWNNIMCLHQDYMQWIVNPPREINQNALVNPEDVVIYPGKDILVRDTANGQSVVRPVTARSKTSDALANSQHYDQHFQRGSMVTDNVQGLPGYRKEVTYREQAMNLDQALGVFSLMGENIEDGACHAIEAAFDVIASNIGYNDLMEVFEIDELKALGIEPSTDVATGVVGIPPFDGSFHVSGIQALMRDAETLKNMREIVIPLSGDPTYKPYIKPLQVLRSIEKRTNLEDEKVFADDNEAKIIDIQQQMAAAKQQDAMQKMQELQEALGIADLAAKLDALDTSDMQKTLTLINSLHAGMTDDPSTGGRVIQAQPRMIGRQ